MFKPPLLLLLLDKVVLIKRRDSVFRSPLLLLLLPSRESEILLVLCDPRFSRAIKFGRAPGSGKKSNPLDFETVCYHSLPSQNTSFHLGTTNFKKLRVGIEFGEIRIPNLSLKV